MDSARRAVIDIGTNSVKLLVADVQGFQVQPVLEVSHQTRLGAGFYPSLILQADRIAATAGAVAEFQRRAFEAGASALCVIATSAAREATNQQHLTDSVKSASGLQVTVISGEQEADWAFQGVTTDPRYSASTILLAETGGGSTQLVLGQSGSPLLRGSLALGTVRLMELSPHSDPPKTSELTACRELVRTTLRQEPGKAVAEALAGARQNGPVLLVGAGGTASILGCIQAEITKFDREALEAAELTASRLNELEQALWSMPLAQRQKVPGLPPNRADVILRGVSIFAAIAELMGFEVLRVSTRGLRFAALLDGNFASCGTAVAPRP